MLIELGVATWAEGDSNDLRKTDITSGSAEIAEAYRYELVPIAAFKEHGRTIATDALHKACVAGIDRTGVHHGDRGTRQDRSGGGHERTDSRGSIIE